MEKEKTRVEKQAYEKPVLTKHGKLKEITTRTASLKKGGDLGCTRF